MSKVIGVKNKVLSNIKYCLYARKSTESDEKQTLSIDSQIKEMRLLAERDELNIVDIRRESHSAKDVAQRPVFNELLSDIRLGEFDGILTWAPDRLARNAGDLGAVVDLMDQDLLKEVRTFGQTFSNSPNEKFLLMILGSQAKLENDQKSINVKRGLRAVCAMGLWPGPAPTGYIKTKNVDDKCKVFVDPKRAPIIKKAFEKIAYENTSGRKVYNWLKHEVDFKTQNGKHLSLGNFYRLLKLPFYYGEFEYPAKSGNWYRGVHTPIISKELFQLAQQKLCAEHDFSYGSKEFAFTRIITCGSCGSGITAQEKTKRQQNGNVHHYVYYCCTKSRDRLCRQSYLREEDLVKQICNIIDEIDISNLGIQKRMKEEVKRFKHFQMIAQTDPKPIKIRDIDMRQYLKYVLLNGSLIERREILTNIKTPIELKDKLLKVE